MLTIKIELLTTLGEILVQFLHHSAIINPKRPLTYFLSCISQKCFSLKNNFPTFAADGFPEVFVFVQHFFRQNRDLTTVDHINNTMHSISQQWIRCVFWIIRLNGLDWIVLQNKRKKEEYNQVTCGQNMSSQDSFHFKIWHMDIYTTWMFTRNHQLIWSQQWRNKDTSKSRDVTTCKYLWNLKDDSTSWNVKHDINSQHFLKKKKKCSKCFQNWKTRNLSFPSPLSAPLKFRDTTRITNTTLLKGNLTKYNSFLFWISLNKHSYGHQAYRLYNHEDNSFSNMTMINP